MTEGIRSDAHSARGVTPWRPAQVNSLFTDAVEASGRLHAILDDLLGLTLHYLTEDYWTVDDSPP